MQYFSNCYQLISSIYLSATSLCSQSTHLINENSTSGQWYYKFKISMNHIVVNNSEVSVPSAHMATLNAKVLDIIFLWKLACEQLINHSYTLRHAKYTHIKNSSAIHYP